MPEFTRKPVPNPEPDLFISDLSALNLLYQAAKIFLERPSLTTKMALKWASEEAEKAFFAQEERLLGATEPPPKGVLRRRA